MKRSICPLIAFFITLLLAGCGLSAPDVALKKRGADNPSSLGLAELCEPGPDCGSVRVNLRKANDDDMWTYWRAGASVMVEQPETAFVKGTAWDLRITKYIPLVGTNGGATAVDEGGGAAARAAFAVLADPPGSFIPKTTSDVSGLAFVEDRYEGLDFGGVKLGSEYQNPLVNAIGPGLLKSYNIRDHSVELSQRIFILKAADGVSYFALRFRYYSRAEGLMIFDWRRLL